MNYKQKATAIEKTCRQVRKHFKTSASALSDYAGIRNDKIMPYVIRYSDENGVLPTVVYMILGSNVTSKSR